jgi:SAM-dependent methyltransferase
VTSKESRRAFLAQNPFPHPWSEGLYFREKMRAIHIGAPDRVEGGILELGGGRSGLTAMLYPGGQVTSVDMDPTFADSPQNRLPGVRFVCADATDLPFDDASFDLVTMFDVIEHIPDDLAAAREVRRVLRPGGVVLVTTPNETWRLPHHRVLRRLCLPERQLMEEWGHARRGYSLDDLGRVLALRLERSVTFITPVSSIGHDLSFSRLPRHLRRAVCAALAPVSVAGYTLHRPDGPGTETMSRWTLPAT